MSTHLIRRSAPVAIALAAALTAAAAPAVACPGPGHRPTREADVARVEQLMRQEIATGVPGVAVRIFDGRHTVSLARQARWTRRDHRLSANDEFRMGSNTKTIVGVLTLQLVAEHKLSLDDPIEKWVPGQVPNGRHITLRMLLDHTSGLFDYILDPAGLARVTGADQRPVTPQQLLALSATHPALFAPGAEWSYSNTNYIALGLAIEKASGQSVDTLLGQRIIDRLGLRHTYLAATPTSRDGARLAAAYEPDAAHLAPLLPPGAPAGLSFAGPARGDHVLVTSLNPSWAWTAGAIVSTPADEQRFLRALNSGDLLPRAQLAQLRTTIVEHPGVTDSARYGLGIEEYRSPCGPVWGHTGGIAGYSTENYSSPDGRRSVSVATTTLFGLHDPKANTADLKVVDAAVCTMLGKPVPQGS